MTHGVFMIIVCYLDCYLQHYIINIIALYFIQTLTQFDIEDIEPISQYFFSVNEHWTLVLTSWHYLVMGMLLIC